LVVFYYCDAASIIDRTVKRAVLANSDHSNRHGKRQKFWDDLQLMTPLGASGVSSQYR
jgi:hypothetical protein